jgi:hypothetical protein
MFNIFFYCVAFTYGYITNNFTSLIQTKTYKTKIFVFVPVMCPKYLVFFSEKSFTGYLKNQILISKKVIKK